MTPLLADAHDADGTNASLLSSSYRQILIVSMSLQILHLAHLHPYVVFFKVLLSGVELDVW